MMMTIMKLFCLDHGQDLSLNIETAL